MSLVRFRPWALKSLALRGPLGSGARGFFFSRQLRFAQQAGDLLNVSRPYLIQLLQQGRIPHAYLAAKNSLLTPREVRFLRKHLGFTQADFAERVNVRAEAVSRWETGAEEISWHFELLLRLMVLLDLHERSYTVKSFDGVDAKRSPAHVRIFSEKADWRPDGTGMLAAARC